MSPLYLPKRKPIFSTVGREGTFKFQPPKVTGPPENWFGTFPEYLVFHELTVTHHFKENEDFTYQSSLTTTGGLPGRLELGGLIADFLLPMSGLVINPISDYYHYANAEVMARELMNRQALAAQNILVIWIDSGDMEESPTYFVNEALSFRDHSKLAASML